MNAPREACLGIENLFSLPVLDMTCIYTHISRDYPENAKKWHKKYFVGMTFNKEYKTTSLIEAKELLMPIIEGLKSINHILLVAELHMDKTVHYHGWLDLKNARKWFKEEMYLFKKYGSLHAEVPKSTEWCENYIHKDEDMIEWAVYPISKHECFHKDECKCPCNLS